MKYQPYVEFTAQGANVRTLMTMYASLDTAPDTVERVIPIIVFMAFSIEAYLNSVGSRCVPFWDELERLPWRSKVNILHKSTSQKANWGEAHLQFATSVFKLRDNLAHGKPERVLGPSFESWEEAHQHLLARKPQPLWYAQLNKAWAYKAKEQFRELMRYLGELHGLHESDHLAISEGGVARDSRKD